MGPEKTARPSGFWMSHNTFGHLFRVTTWGESHGPALGCVVDGCPPGLRFRLSEIQQWMDRRKPGQSAFVTQRREDDIVKVLSGVMTDADGETLVTTGTPVSMLIENTVQGLWRNRPPVPAGPRRLHL
jgi:chorismate synthase